MNQILASSRVYVTKEIRRKQKFYKITFTLSVITLIILLTYYVLQKKEEMTKKQYQERYWRNLVKTKTVQ